MYIRSPYRIVDINRAMTQVKALGNVAAPMLTTPFFGAAVVAVAGASATTGSFLMDMIAPMESKIEASIKKKVV